MLPLHNSCDVCADWLDESENENPESFLLTAVVEPEDPFAKTLPTYREEYTLVNFEVNLNKWQSTRRLPFPDTVLFRHLPLPKGAVYFAEADQQPFDEEEDAFAATFDAAALYQSLPQTPYEEPPPYVPDPAAITAYVAPEPSAALTAHEIAAARAALSGTAPQRPSMPRDNSRVLALREKLQKTPQRSGFTLERIIPKVLPHEPEKPAAPDHRVYDEPPAYAAPPQQQQATYTAEPDIPMTPAPPPPPPPPRSDSFEIDKNTAMELLNSTYAKFWDLAYNSKPLLDIDSARAEAEAEAAREKNQRISRPDTPPPQQQTPRPAPEPETPAEKPAPSGGYPGTEGVAAPFIPALSAPFLAEYHDGDAAPAAAPEPLSPIEPALSQAKPIAHNPIPWTPSAKGGGMSVLSEFDPETDYLVGDIGALTYTVTVADGIATLRFSNRDVLRLSHPEKDLREDQVLQAIRFSASTKKKTAKKAPAQAATKTATPKSDKKATAAPKKTTTTRRKKAEETPPPADDAFVAQLQSMIAKAVQQKPAEQPVKLEDKAPAKPEPPKKHDTPAPKNDVDKFLSGDFNVDDLF